MSSDLKCWKIRIGSLGITGDCFAEVWWATVWYGSGRKAGMDMDGWGMVRFRRVVSGVIRNGVLGFDEVRAV